MDPNWLSGAAAVVSALVAVGALIVAALANRRADEANTHAQVANERARNAYNLQVRIDDRDREFRMVSWGVEPGDDDEARSITITNVGLSEARSVTMVVFLGGDHEVVEFPVLRKGDSVTVSSPRMQAWLKAAWEYEVLTPKVMVHWSSPLGKASHATINSKDLGDYIDFEQYDEG
jgi:hypothetical protein